MYGIRKRVLQHSNGLWISFAAFSRERKRERERERERERGWAKGEV